MTVWTSFLAKVTETHNQCFRKLQLRHSQCILHIHICLKITNPDNIRIAFSWVQTWRCSRWWLKRALLHKAFSKQDELTYVTSVSLQAFVMCFLFVGVLWMLTSTSEHATGGAILSSKFAVWANADFHSRFKYSYKISNKPQLWHHFRFIEILISRITTSVYKVASNDIWSKLSPSKGLLKATFYLLKTASNHWLMMENLETIWNE